MKKQSRGRRGRKGTRVAGQAETSPVRGGMNSGLIRVLPEGSEAQIHAAALDVLENIGLAEAPQNILEIVIPAGGYLNDAGRLCFPRGLVEDTIANANRSFVICGQDPRHDIELSGSRVYFGTGGGTISTVDPQTGEYSKPGIRDLYDYARIVDRLDNIHFFQRSATPQDIESTDDLDINICYACVRGTSKPVGVSWNHAHNVSRSLEMFHLIAGSEAKWRERPFVTQTCAFTVSPLKFAPESCLSLEASVRGGLPVQLASVPQAGATSPVTLAGTIMQSVAESLAGLVFANLIQPKAKVYLGLWTLVSDLRTGAMSGGSPEMALLMAGASQMARYYDLPNAVASGLTDSKIPDAQAGYEKGCQHTFIANAGGNMIYAAAGVLASITACSNAGLVIDNDIIGMALRTLSGVKVDAEELALESVRSVNLDGPGHYLRDPLTIERMKQDFYYPQVGDRLSPQEWIDSGSLSAVDRAVEIADDILQTHYPEHISGKVDAQIRDKFDILLPYTATRPAPK